VRKEKYARKGVPAHSGGVSGMFGEAEHSRHPAQKVCAGTVSSRAPHRVTPTKPSSDAPQRRLLEPFFTTLSRWSRVDFGATYTGPPFRIFSPLHNTMLGLLVLENLAVQLFFQWHKSERAQKLFRYGFATLILLDIALWHTWQVATGRWRISESLPLHICNISILLCGLLLLTRNQVLYELCYFWSMGAVQAILTPPLNEYSFPHYAFFRNFISHNSIIVAVGYMTVVEKYRPSWKSVKHIIGLTTTYMGVVHVINAFTRGNYLYIARKPNFSTPIDYLGPWPLYVVGMYIIGLIVILASYMPFAVYDILVQRYPQHMLKWRKV
jgi:hypothetical integral membrane protein (TIGR02206 family)